MGYKKGKIGPVSVVCPEYGIFAEGETKQKAIYNLIVLVRSFLIKNDKSIVDDLLEVNTPTMLLVWSLYRKYEKLQLDKIRVDISQIKKKKKIEKETITQLENINKKLEEKLQITNQILNMTMQENKKLKKELKFIKDSNVIDDGIGFLEDSKYSKNSYYG